MGGNEKGQRPLSLISDQNPGAFIREASSGVLDRCSSMLIGDADRPVSVSPSRLLLPTSAFLVARLVARKEAPSGQVGRRELRNGLCLRILINGT